MTTLQELASDLGVDYYPQDWGIITADPDRWEAFIQYFEQHATLPSTLRFQLMELILASYNEAMLEELTTADTQARFAPFILAHQAEELYRPHWTYWKGLEGDEFPIGELLRAL